MAAQCVMRRLAETAEASCTKWLSENAAAFDAQATWHSRHGHPLADIIAGPGASSWKDADQSGQIAAAIEAFKADVSGLMPR